MKKFLVLLTLAGSLNLFAQNEQGYYYEIPAYSDQYTAGTVAARMIDGLGFRYYWGTAALNDSDLDFRPSEGARNVMETIDHICALAGIIEATVNQSTYSGVSLEGMTFAEKRAMTLQSLEQASKKLKEMSESDLQAATISFSSGAEFPFWNLINGPIADAINHVGQIITFRRTNGNPINPNISVLQGKVKN